MKNKSIPHILMSAMFAFLFSLGAVGCLLTGFDLPIASHGRLWALMILFSVLPPLLLSFRRGIWILLLLSAPCGYWIWQDGALWDQLQSFAYTVSCFLYETYDFPIIGTALSETFDLVLILCAYLTAVITGLCVLLRWHMGFALPPVIIALALPLMSADTVPDSVFLYLLLLGIVMLLIIEHTRNEYPTQTVPLILRTVIPVSAALALLFFCNPRGEYINRAQGLSEKVDSWFTLAEEGFGTGTSGSGGEGDGVELGADEVELRYVGARDTSPFPVMRVTVSYDGTVYLRGRDYDVYTGTSWRASDGRNEQFTTGTGGSDLLIISTYGVHDLLYTPYYSLAETRLSDGFLKNKGNITAYRYYVSQTPKRQSPDLMDYSHYTALPEGTAEWAEPLVGAIVPGTAVSHRERAEAIGTYVRNSASYSLSPSVMSSAYEDFAQWFLEKSDTGYCIHFASSAVVLLRAAGIPARYVEGYMISCESAEETMVTVRQAHAWAEYYDSDDSVWRILDATPTVSGENGEETVVETAVPETEPPETDASETAIPETEKKPSGDVPSESVDAETEEVIPDGTDSDPNEKKEPFRVSNWVKGVILILLCVGVIPIQGEIRIAVNRKRWNRGSPNERALVRWRICRRIAGPMKHPLPKELDELALKAKFSQYTLTQEELTRFDLFRNALAAKINTLPLMQKLALRWIFAVE